MVQVNMYRVNNWRRLRCVLCQFNCLIMWSFVFLSSKCQWLKSDWKHAPWGFEKERIVDGMYSKQLCKPATFPNSVYICIVQIICICNVHCAMCNMQCAVVQCKKKVKKGWARFWKLFVLRFLWKGPSDHWFFFQIILIFVPIFILTIV